MSTTNAATTQCECASAVTELREEIASLHEEIADLREESEQKTQQIKSLEARLTRASTRDQCESHGDGSDDRVNELEVGDEELDAATTLTKQLAQKDERIESLENQVNDLSEDQKQDRAYSARERAKLSSRVNDIEENGDVILKESDDDEGGSSMLPFMEIRSMAMDVFRKNSTKNQALAKQYAEKFPDVAQTAPNGCKLVTAKNVSNFFAARDYGRLDTKTVSRIMTFLARFGGEHVTDKVDKGKRKLVFDSTIVTAINAYDDRRHGGKSTRGV